MNRLLFGDNLKWLRLAKFIIFLAMILIVGCNKPASDSAKSDSTSSEATISSTNPTETAKTDGPKENEKVCFACKGLGTVKCTAPGCVDGYVDCPGPCLKLTRGTWVHLDVPGHPPTDLWQKFYQSDGSYTAYNQNHVGHIVKMVNGKAVDTGSCPICGGTGKVPCPVCKGTGRVVCPICDGEKYIPVAWTPTDNPWLDRQPDLMRLLDGRIFFGKIVISNETFVTIKTRDGKYLEVDVTNILPNAEMVSTNAVAP